jgi:uncharacterized protein (TIGR03067 family)
MKKPLLGMLTVALLLAADSPKGYDDTAIQTNDLPGAWHLIGVERNGMAVGFAPIVETYRDGKFTTTDSTDAVTDEGIYKVDSRHNPGHLEETSLTTNKGRTYLYIYRLEGELLKIGYKGDCSVRPTSFKEAGVIILTFKREKK